MSTTTEDHPNDEPAHLIPSLPDDVAINILSRVPRSHHPILSSVSKPFRSLFSSPLLFATRRHISATEPCLYLCLRLTINSAAGPTPSLHFYALRRHPTTQKRSLTPISTLPPLIGAAFVTLGPTIYIIGGSLKDIPSLHVRTLDCRFHTWGSAPNMRVAREFGAAGVIEDRIYVMGGCVADNWHRSRFWAEMFDSNSRIWESVASPVECKERWMHASAVIGGKFYAMADRGGVKFDPKAGTWDIAEKRLDLGWRGRACVIDEILYCYDYLGKIRGFDFKENVWKELKGVDDGLPRFLCGATMANCGERLVVTWEGKCGSSGKGKKEMEIWCAEIQVGKSKDGDLIGKLQWVDMVLSVPNGSCIVHCLAVTL